MLIAGTRVALGVGLGLLIAGRLNQEVRKGAGWTLLAMGALTTIPILTEIVGREHGLKAEGKRAA
jgi:hypothetical protein